MASPASIARHPIPSHARRLSDRALGLLVRGRPRPCRGRGAVLDRPGFLHDLGGLIGVLAVPGLIDVLSLHGARVRRIPTMHLVLNLAVVAQPLPSFPPLSPAPPPPPPLRPLP